MPVVDKKPSAPVVTPPLTPSKFVDDEGAVVPLAPPADDGDAPAVPEVITPPSGPKKFRVGHHLVGNPNAKPNGCHHLNEVVTSDQFPAYIDLDRLVSIGALIPMAE